MAQSESHQSYPQLPAAVWWSLRDRFIQAIPPSVTETYMVTVLDVDPSAARQYLKYLTALDLIDENGVPTELARELRDDEKYRDVCHQILEQVYPVDLRSIAPPPNPSRSDVVRWFMHSAGLGKGTAENKAAMYMLLAEGDVSRRTGRRKSSSGDSERARTPSPAARRSSPVSRTATRGQDSAPARGDEAPAANISKELQLNIQIHISPEASPAQIDAIFESMAKHLKV